MTSFVGGLAPKLDPSKPFFYVQHAHPQNTCYGNWAWGAWNDKGSATAALSPYPNAVAFSGHSHYSLTDERGIWQGAFTSIGTSSLSCTVKPFCTKRVLEENFFLADDRMGKTGRCVFALDELPKNGFFRFAVRPLECFGKTGSAIYSGTKRLA